MKIFQLLLFALLGIACTPEEIGNNCPPYGEGNEFYESIAFSYDTTGMNWSDFDQDRLPIGEVLFYDTDVTVDHNYLSAEFGATTQYRVAYNDIAENFLDLEEGEIAGTRTLIVTGGDMYRLGETIVVRIGIETQEQSFPNPRVKIYMGQSSNFVEALSSRNWTTEPIFNGSGVQTGYFHMYIAQFRVCEPI